MSTPRILSLLTLSLVASVGALAQAPSASLRHLSGTDPESGIEYTRIILPGSTSAPTGFSPVAFTGTPTLIAQCTRQPSGKQAFDLFLSFGQATDLDFHAPLAPSPTHPRPKRVDVALDFSGYTHVPLKRQWEDLREPSGLLRYATPSFHSANMEDAPILLRYLVALPTLRLTEANRSATFDTLPLLSDIRSEPLCKASLL